MILRVWFGWKSFAFFGFFVWCLLPSVGCSPSAPSAELIIVPGQEGGATDGSEKGKEAVSPEARVDALAESTEPREGRLETEREGLHSEESPQAEVLEEGAGVEFSGDGSPSEVSLEQTAPEKFPEEPRPEKKPETPKESTLPDDQQYIGRACQAGGRSGTCQFTTVCRSQTDKEPIAGFCPGTSAVQCCVPKTTTSTCDPNAKPTPHAGMSEAPGTPGCPAGMIRVSTFCIDQFEAALLEILPNGTTQPWSPFFNPGTRKVKAVSIRGAIPQGYIHGRQAAAACQEAGKRLCTDTEWLRACQGPTGSTYPYGMTRQAGLCNDARSVHPAVEYFGTSDPSVFSKIQHQCINQIPASLLPTGQKTGCVTAEGVFDMMGNLHEWTADPAGTFRGGYYVDTYRNGNGCLYRTTAHDTGHWDYSTGFRCCATPSTP